MKKITTLLIMVLIAISCGDAKKENSKDTSKTTAVNLKSIEVDIEGMTCEIGCARLIQSKLSKVDGVTYTKVNFETKKGIFTYNSNKLDKNDISNKIAQIAGGDLYSVTKIKELENIVTKIDKLEPKK